MSKVSVVTICFNEEKNIVETIESVINQTYLDVEYIIKDGCSQDRTNEIIESVIDKNKHINIKHIIKKDTGIYNAMNQAIDECTGEWIIFINAGDLFWAKDTLKKIFQEADVNESEILFGNVLMRDVSGDRIWKGKINQLPYKMPFGHPACLIKREVLKQMRFNERYRIVADYELILRCYENGYKFWDLDEIITIFKLNGVSSTKYLKKYKEHIQVLKDHNLYTNKKRVLYPVEIMIALIKEVIDKRMPIKLQIVLRKVYMKRIKKYV